MARAIIRIMLGLDCFRIISFLKRSDCGRNEVLRVKISLIELTLFCKFFSFSWR